MFACSVGRSGWSRDAAPSGANHTTAPPGTASIKRISAQVQRRPPTGLAIEPRAADRHQLASPHDGQPRMLGLDHLTPPLPAHRPDAFAKKSRSTSNCPILACRFSTSASAALAMFCPADLPEKTPASPSTACRFQSLTIVWWMPRFVASCAAVSSPRSASSATFALKADECRVRLPVRRARPSQKADRA